MRISIKKICTIAITILMVQIMGFVYSNNDVYARITESWDGTYGTISKKANLTGVVRCYNGHKMVETIDNVSNFYNIYQITNNSDSNEDYVALPSGLTKVGDDGVSCEQLYKKGSYFGGSFSGIFDLAGKPEYSGAISGDESKATLLEGMGYKKTRGSRCVQYGYTMTSGPQVNSTVTTKSVCFKDGTLSLEGSSGMGTALSFSVSDKRLTITGSSQTARGVSIPTILNYDDYETWGGFVDAINTELVTKFEEVSVGTTRYKLNKEELQNNVSGTSFELPSNMAYLNALKFLGGIDEYNDLAFTKQEQLQYFLGVLKNYYVVETVCDVEDSSFYPDYTPISLDLSGNRMKKGNNCYIKPTENIQGKAHGLINSSSLRFFDADGSHGLSFEDVVFEVEALVSGMSDEELGEVIADTTDTSDKDKCLSSGGAGNMGYIICEILDMVGNAATEIYESALAPALRIEPKLFTDGGGTEQAWSIFQSLANVTFTILILIVIFSQLTGIGIDNYGIKKILPKLIVTAILVNLSYIICVICVDLSNIIGNGIQDLFNNLPTGAPDPSLQGVGDINIGTEISVGLLSGLAIGGAAVMIWANPAMVITLLVGALGVIIAVFFVFILLSAREAAIVVLTVISPVAFICYALPNTKSIFDKYIKASKGLLLLYPICGLLIGGGDFVSRLLLSSGVATQGFWSALVAMLAGIIPIFFIPAVLKSSLAAIGNIGATVSNLGNRLRGGATKGIRNSGAYKNVQELSKERSTRLRAGIGEDGKPIDVSKMSRASRFLRGISVSNRGIARNRAQYNKDQKDRDAENLLLDSTYMGNMEAHRATALSNEREKMYSEVYERETDRGKVEAELNTALRGNDAERASAALNSLVKKGGVDEALKALSGANWSGMNSSVRDRVVQAMSGSGVDAMKAYATYRNTNGKASFDDWAHGRVNAGDSVANTKNKTYAQYLQQQKEHAIDNYGKDEMQFVDGLKSELYSQMGKDDYGAMMGSALLNSTNAQAQDIVDRIATSDITNGNLRASDYRFSSKGLSTIRQEAALSLGNGYLGRGETLNDLRNDLQVPIRGIKADPRMAGSMGQVTRGIFNI